MRFGFDVEASGAEPPPSAKEAATNDCAARAERSRYLTV